MLFNTPIYIFLFLPVVVSVYFLLNKIRLTTCGKIWLISASLFFYAYWNPIYLLLICGSVVVNFTIGIALRRIRLDERLGHLTRRSILIGGIAFNLALLGYFKYADFLIGTVNWTLGAHLPIQNIVLPLAISFFTFQQIAYLVDCYQVDTQEYDFLNYCIFVTFFPQLISGPIVHHTEMMPQFARLRNRVVDWNNIALGIAIFSIGLFKKTVIADSFAVWANAGFHSTGVITFYEAWASSFSYTFQLYYDFSGYMDMAIGAALFFNIRLPINFNSPYKATDIQDFWRRWHMTLSRWFRQYVYIPLGGNRGSDFRTLINIFMTFLLAGLWHGAAWTFVIWGALTGMGLLVHVAWKKAGRNMPALLGWFFTFMFFNLSVVVFRAENLDIAMRMYSAMLFPKERFLFGYGYVETINDQSLFGFMFSNPGQFSIYVWLPLVIFALLALVGPNSVQRAGFVAAHERWRFKPDLKHAIAVGLILFASFLTFFGQVAPSEFLYFNF